MDLISSVISLEKWQALCPCKIVRTQPDQCTGQKYLWAQECHSFYP